jgi:phosphoribosylanthranilate isomerase
MVSSSKTPTAAPQVKICGITRVVDAAACVAYGADAIGFVFYKKSPRHVQNDQARKIIATLPQTICKVGVFVNESYDTVMTKADYCGLNAIQLHGNETPQLVKKLQAQKLIVIKALYMDGSPSVYDADNFEANAFLVECAQGKLPGGNALTWDWQAAVGLGQKFPLILAGGLAPENIKEALIEAQPDAADVSSGVETAPGIKDPNRIDAFIKAVKSHGLTRPARRIFNV